MRIVIVNTATGIANHKKKKKMKVNKGNQDIRSFQSFCEILAESNKNFVLYTWLVVNQMAYTSINCHIVLIRTMLTHCF